MSRSSSPATHWDQLEAWLHAITDKLLLETAGDLQHLGRDRLDDMLNLLMANDPTQDYSSRELARFTGTLANNLLAQVKLLDRNVDRLEQEVTTLTLPSEEARRNPKDAGYHRDQQAVADEEDMELREEVERLQDALASLHTDFEHREQQEEKARKEITKDLHKAEALLVKAEAELQERDAKIKLCENHLQTARAEAQDLAQQRDHLKNELDTVQRELKYAYQMQTEPTGERYSPAFPLTTGTKLFIHERQATKGGENPLFKTLPASTTEPPAPTEGGRGPVERTGADTHGVSPKDLDKLARNILTFTPDPAGGHEVHTYLQDIDFHVQTLANVTMRDRLYLLRTTSSREVRSFLDRQPKTVKADYQQLRQALIREFSDPESEQGLITALDLKQARLETPHAYYHRLRLAYFGSRNEPEMEEDFNFRTLFLRNLHPSVSRHLGVMACPHTMTTRQLRDLAHRAYELQKAASKNPATLSLSEHHPELTPEGTHQQHRARPSNRESKDFTASWDHDDHNGAWPSQ